MRGFQIRRGDLTVLKNGYKTEDGWCFKYFVVMEAHWHSVFGWIIDDREGIDTDEDYPYTKGRYKVYCETEVTYDAITSVRRKL